jgi:hypothetical protein
MPFLNPLVLLGLAAAAIPILVHLFNFRRPRRLDFPSLRFVRELERKAMRRVRLRQWLLLALRTLAILALVVAFARPLLPSAWRAAFGARPPAAVAMVVDNSMSMTLRDSRGAFIDQARAVAGALADAAPAGDALVLLPTAADAAPDRLSATPAPLLDALDVLQPRHGAETLASAAGRAASILEGDDRPHRELYLVSDLQESTLADSIRAPIPEGIRLVLVPVGEGPRVNTAVTDVRVASRRVEPGRPVRISITVARFGGAGGPVPVRVLLEGEPAAEGVVEVQPGTPATTSLTVMSPRPGWVRGEVQLAQGDAFPSDDTRPFVLEAPAARSVLLVRGEDRGTEYLRLALGVGAETGSVVVNEVAESAIPIDGLGAYDVVVLVGPRAPSAAASDALGAFVEAGGGVMLMPHATPTDAAYDRLFAALGAGRLDGFAGTPGGTTMGALGDVDVEHPLFSGLLEEDDRGRIEGPEVAYFARYVPGGGHESTIARLSAGAPFLQEVRRGRGAFLFMSVAPDPAWSDLPTRALFAPLVLRSVDYLAGVGASAGAATALRAGRPGIIRLEGADADEQIEFWAPDGVVVPAESRVVPGAVLLDVDAPQVPGVYEVRQGDRTLQLVAVQPDAGESDLRALPPEEAAERLSAATGREVTVLDARGAAGEAALSRRGVGTPLWTIFVVLALAFLVAETVVATRWKPGGEAA